MTITCGHALDAMCYILGELTALCSRISTRVQRWRNAETGETVDVTSPDTISIAGALADGAEIAVQVATAFNPTGSRLEIHGREGTLVIKGKLLHIGPNRLSGARHGESLKVLSTPDRYVLTPGGLPRGWAANVAQAYVRLANSVRSGEPIDPDFDAAVRLHRLIRAIERSAQEGESLVAPWP
jgi:predicted dehydrogenase